MCTIDSSLKVYVNGEEAGSMSATGTQITNGTSPLIIGALNTYIGTYDFDGGIGQVRMYDSALSQTQIRQNYNFTKPSYPNGYDGIIGTGAYLECCRLL